MDIPQVTTAPTSAPAAISPVASGQVVSVAQTQAAALLAQTTVDLSPLGRFLSAVTLFQKRILELQANPAAVAADAEEALAAVASSAVALSESANALQASLLNGTSDDQSLGTLFNQQFNAQTDSADEGDSPSLAAIGLTFAPGLDGEDVLDVDSAVLQAAFVADPAGTAALLGRTATAFGALTGVAAEAGADPSVLFADPAPESAATGLPAQASSPGLPELSDPAPPLSSDNAFLQELLAETPKPALALTQAPPPAVAEANATFAAERAAEARPGDGAAPLPPPLPDPASAAAAAATQTIGTPRAPAAPDLPPTASQVAVDATASAAAPRPAPIAPDSQTLPLQASEQAAATQAARTLAGQGNTSRIAVRDTSNRIADTIAAERDAGERIAGAAAAGRAAQGAELETQDIDEAAVTRAADKTFEQRRLDEDATDNRLERALEARRQEAGDANDADPGASLRARVAATLAQNAPGIDAAPEVVVPQAQPLPLSNAQQLARDPAVMAAIAAYNLSAGPFAALNGRPEIAAQRPKLVPAVESVDSVEAIETDAATSDSARPFR